ncbi:LacI family DNA-binding transcriptional regulator [Labrys okinawensis]|uniref:LacI family DNA-binding transcriptional regulator n=1 Tax=Labrys okinawensis TaxID=346911 RepID=UPI0039BC3AD7
MKKATLADIAREAGVGTATVERVLNSRGNVTASTIEKVIQAMRHLGSTRALPQRYSGVLRIEVLMVRRETPFFKRLNDAFLRISESLDSSILLHRTFVDENDPKSVAGRIAEPGFRRVGLIIVAPDHPAVRERLSEERAKGVAIVQIVTRIDGSNDAFVGIDNYAAGRMAAMFMSRMLRGIKGRIVAVCHSGVYEVHRQRILGFSDYLAEHSDADRMFSRVLFGLDQDLRSGELVESAIEEDARIVGIYNAGGANAGIAEVLKRRKQDPHIMWVGHELTDESRLWLKSGLMDIVLDQAPETQARRAIDTVLRKINFLTVEVSTEPVRFYTITAENV